MPGFKRLPLFPSPAIPYLLISVGIVACLLIFIDRVLLPALVNSGSLVSADWVGEDEKLQEYMWARNMADNECPIWRSPQWPVSPEKRKAKRILVLGDSFVWGHGYANMNTIWWRQLQKELARRGYHDVEVIGAGMCNSGTHKELNWVKKYAPIYKPDLVVVGYVTNDPEETSPQTGKSLTKEPFTVDLVKDDLPLPVHSAMVALLPNLSDRLFWTRTNLVRSHLLLSGKEVDLCDWELEMLKGENFEQYKNTVKELGKYARESKTPIFFMTLPAVCSETPHSKIKAPFMDELVNYYSTRYEPVKPLFDAAGVKFLDNLKDFAAAVKDDPSLPANHWLGINPVNRHPSSMVTHFYAVEAANIIEKGYPQALGAVSKGDADIVTRKPNINDWVPPSLEVRKLSDYRYQIVLPHSNDDFLFLPIKKRFFQLSLEDPIAARQIKLEGDCLTGADIYLTCEDPQKHYDDDVTLELGEKTGKSLSWVINDKRYAGNINTIKIAPRMRGVERRLTLELSK